MTIPCLNDARPEIAERIARCPWVLLGLDFDGTLTPLQPRPEAVVLAEPVRALLARLARRERLRVMIVSGRGRADVAERVGVPGLVYAGDHGMEIEGPGVSFREPTAARLVPRLAAITGRLQAELNDLPGVFVEPKPLTVSVHYRNLPTEHWEELANRVAAAVASDPAAVVLSAGHRIWEIRPRAAWHKGRALEWVARRHAGAGEPLVCFLGDDRTDEDAFAMFPEGITVKVGAPTTDTRARYWLADPAAVREFLEWLAGLPGVLGKE